MVFHRLCHVAILKTISIYVSFFPVLVHEREYAFAAQISCGYVTDIRMIMTSRQQNATGKQGYAETIAKHKLSFIIITFDSYCWTTYVL